MRCQLIDAALALLPSQPVTYYYLIWIYSEWINAQLFTFSISISLSPFMFTFHLSWASAVLAYDIAHCMADQMRTRKMSTLKFNTSQQISVFVITYWLWHCCNYWNKIKTKENDKEGEKNKTMQRQINIPNKLARFQLYLQICIFYMLWRPNRTNKTTTARKRARARKEDCLQFWL